MSAALSTISGQNTTQPSPDSSIDVQVYYDGLATKHWVALRRSSTFLELKECLSRPEFASIPIENQKLIHCGLVPRDSETMASHGVPSGRFRVCLVRVKSPGELWRSEEAAVDEEAETETETRSETLSNEIRGILEDQEHRLGWVGRFTGEQGERQVTNWPYEGSDGDALSIAFFDAAR